MERTKENEQIFEILAKFFNSIISLSSQHLDKLNKLEIIENFMVSTNNNNVVKNFNGFCESNEIRFLVNEVWKLFNLLLI